MKRNWNCNSPLFQPQQTQFLFFSVIKILHSYCWKFSYYRYEQRKKYDFSQTPCPHLPAACAFQITSTKTHGNVRGWHLSLREFRITICRVFANHIFLLKNCLNILLCQYTWFYVIHFKVCKKFDSLVVSYFLKNFYCYSITVVCILFFYKYFPVYKIWGGWYFLILQNKQCSVKVGHVRLSVYVEYFHEKVPKSSVVSFQNLIRYGRVFL